jgi:hypothetical protein
MGKRNYLFEGVSGTDKTSVCHELPQRGYKSLNGDRNLHLHTNTTTGERLITFSSPENRHASNLWDVEKVRRLAVNPLLMVYNWKAFQVRHFAVKTARLPAEIQPASQAENQIFTLFPPFFNQSHGKG